ncbi:ABC transporter permease [Nonomuraea gerenzanensis]|uniref:Transport permease protein n=1 Tax=Nonomuraea gerenzanensis TaxID=93944 RepID=A0A1M4EHL7_9ACTN|nr:ABC transporter permease [Nonomuraea gerenzanensis]UBU09806.1 ABC transporter permease [Nonomuraea gerenzanensis]SBO98254.1 ABC-2 type transporter [Nonomuraea gerenzanensis]
MWSQEVLALSRRWLLMTLRERLNLLFSVLQPAVWLIFFAGGMGGAVDARVVGTGDYIAFAVPGVIAFTVVGNGVTAAMPLLFDKETGYLDKLLSMPIRRSSLIVSRFVFQVGMNSAQVLVILLVAFALGVRPASGPLGVLAILLVTALLTLALTAAAMALACAVPSHGTFFAITGFASLPLLFMSNAFVPLSAMPGWMEVVARVNPLTYAIEAMRVLVLRGWGAGVPVSLGALAVASALLLAVGAWQFTRQTSHRIT